MKMRTTIRTWPLALVLVAGVSCNPPGATAERDSKAAGSTAGGPSEAGKKPVSVPADLSSIPAELKHDAYGLYGFDRAKPLNYVFAKMQGDKPLPGTQSSELKEIKDGTAAFTVNRTGSLEAIGREELLVKADGVYVVSTSLGSPKSPVMLMPASVKPGTVWDYNYELTPSTGGKMSFKGKARAVKTEKIKVAAGTFDVLQVSETATMDNNGTKGTVSSKTWYAKNVGVVKMRMEVKNQDGNVVTSTIELGGPGTQ